MAPRLHRPNKTLSTCSMQYRPMPRARPHMNMASPRAHNGFARNLQLPHILEGGRSAPPRCRWCGYICSGTTESPAGERGA
eukprot:6181874-Pleurochrysis_carterae.AAC.1